MARRVTFTPERFLRRIWELGDFDVSQDGSLLAYSANKGAQWTVFVRDLRTGRERHLVRSAQAMLNPEFSPDGRTIAMQADFEGDENSDVYVASVEGGKPRRLTHDPMDDAFPRFSPDGKRIAFISNRKGDRENVFVMDADGRGQRQLTFVDDIVQEIAWRPDGRAIAFEAGVGDRDWVGLVDLNGHVKRLVSFPNSENELGADAGRPSPWSPDCRMLAFVSNVHDRLDLGVLELPRRKVRWLVRNRWDKTMPVWSPHGDRVAFLENHDGNVMLKTVGRGGQEVRSVSPAIGAATRPRWHPDGRSLFYEHSTSDTPPGLILQRGAKRTRLVESARVPLPRAEVARARLVRYPTFDGRKIPAWLHMPKGNRYRNAAIVRPHGGPEAQVLNEWDTDTQLLVAQGYAMLRPNYRGGTGYGRAWRRISDKDLGGGDMKDIIAGGHWLLERGICPPGRLGIIGVSYGGYAVAHCLEQAPDLWAVGVSIVGYFNWFTACRDERGSLEKYDRWKMGDLEADEGRFRRFSPMFYLDKIRAPVLFTGGAHDPRCPVTEARQMTKEMKKAGKVVEYLEFPDEGHRPRRTANQIKEARRTIAWLNRFLPDG